MNVFKLGRRSSSIAVPTGSEDARVEAPPVAAFPPLALRLLRLVSSSGHSAYRPGVTRYAPQQLGDEALLIDQIRLVDVQDLTPVRVDDSAVCRGVKKGHIEQQGPAPRRACGPFKSFWRIPGCIGQLPSRVPKLRRLPRPERPDRLRLSGWGR